MALISSFGRNSFKTYILTTLLNLLLFLKHHDSFHSRLIQDGAVKLCVPCEAAVVLIMLEGTIPQVNRIVEGLSGGLSSVLRSALSTDTLALFDWSQITHPSG